MEIKFVTAQVLCAENGRLNLHIICGEEQMLYRDITQSLKDLKDFAEKINKNQVSLVHIEELIEDFLL